MTVKTVYLAHPIDQANGDTPTDVSAIAHTLALHGFSCFLPSKAWYASNESIGSIQRTNDAVLDTCDAVVVYIPHSVPTIGTILEMARALNSGQHVVVYTDIPAGVSAAVESLQCDVVRSIADIPPALMAPSRSVAKWEGNGTAPKQGKPGDAGFDLYVSGDEPVSISPGGFCNVPSEIGVQLPGGMWGMILGRSSSWARRLYVAPAVIDAGYRGLLYACTWNVSDDVAVVAPGERIAQIVPFPLTADGVVWRRGTLDPSDRGDTGFGSTGR